MRFDPFRSISKLEKKSPALARFIAIHFLSFLSPFNAHLGSRLIEWTNQDCKIFLKRRKRVRNHVATIHAGALFTLGETCAGLVIIRNFPFEGFRPLMSEVHATYSKQARDDVTGEAHIPPEKIAAMHADLARGEIPKVDVVTNIYDKDRLLIASVMTVWQVKPWKLVQTK
jgi:acyl-coenzyme A thioesterase PaaI-like protein